MHLKTRDLTEKDCLAAEEHGHPTHQQAHQAAYQAACQPAR